MTLEPGGDGLHPVGDAADAVDLAHDLVTVPAVDTIRIRTWLSAEAGGRASASRVGPALGTAAPP